MVVTTKPKQTPKKRVWRYVIIRDNTNVSTGYVRAKNIKKATELVLEKKLPIKGISYVSIITEPYDETLSTLKEKIDCKDGSYWGLFPLSVININGEVYNVISYGCSYKSETILEYDNTRWYILVCEEHFEDECSNV